ncbi:MAG: heterodisulfide reductase-related iron-sulfur binding cluster [Bacteroidetes bacterium]|nr:heterodisulfide reductase-related iron-sulfur binding cluster [Bacteroidota bacterium]
MIKQIIFAITVFITLAVFAYTIRRIIAFFRLTQPFPAGRITDRINVMLKVALGQSKIFRRPVIGSLHALVFWGFCVILFGSIEMIIDGLAGTTRILSFLGPVYDVLIASGDIFALLVLISIIAFMVRRLFLHIKRFTGTEMKHKSHIDANIALILILLLMVSLLGLNIFYMIDTRIQGAGVQGAYPVSQFLSQFFYDIPEKTVVTWHEVFWWTHILMIFLFANILPYSKHFHVFMSVPNVFLSRLEPLGYLYEMKNVTKEVKLMMNPDTAFSAVPEGVQTAVARFGVKDAEDVTWKNYLDALTCTECGRCTSVCPANITGKKLSPRKIFMDLRARMKEKGPELIKNGKGYSDSKSLIRDYISVEELWACTTCNACAQECPVNINHPSLIVDMRRYLVMEEAAGPGELNAVFTNIENNGAPWQFSPEDRILWTNDLTNSKGEKITVPIISELALQGKTPEYLFWVGSTGAFDDRYKKVTREFIRILDYLNVDYAILGKEESDSGDTARRGGNEMLFLMQAFTNIEVLNGYGVKKIITCDPHDYNTLKNEYPDFGGHYEVFHHTQFLRDQIKQGNLKISPDIFKSSIITYHDPCYLGRANGEYTAPREVLRALPARKTEMQRCKSFALCCGAGGGQMFKEAEKGDKEVFIERIEDAIATGADIIATACPFCMTMMTDGIKYKNKEETIKNLDIAELVSQAMSL